MLPSRPLLAASAATCLLGFAAPASLARSGGSAAPAAPAAPAATVVVDRGPYLQDVGAQSATIVWRTDQAVTGGVRLGRVPGPPWDLAVTPPGSGTGHTVAVDGLVPDTRYFYQLTADGQPIGAVETLRTYPPKKSTRPFRFVAWGDSGTGSGLQLHLASTLSSLAPAPDLALGMGDLVYEVGAWEDYDEKFFAPYHVLMRRGVLWAAIGNHDQGTAAGAPYYANFHLPTDTGAPGHPSGTEAYYSFDHGSAHFVCLDTTGPIEPGGPQYTWLADDLDAANAAGARWRIVFTHKPPYSKGSHDSTTEADLIQLQTDLVPLLEAKGVDIYVAGHSHVYERSYLATAGVVMDDDPSEYLKTGSAGTLYVVSGCGGKAGSGPLDHPLMAHASGTVAGHTVFDVGHEEIRGHFLEGGTLSQDSFTLRKAPDLTPPRIAAAEALGPDFDVVRLAFSEPVLPGTGPGGAEAVSSYSISSGSVLGATLSSDQRTVLLQTTPHTEGLAHAIFVTGVTDQSPGGNAIASNSVRAYAISPAGGVPQGATWRYFEGPSFPGAAWMQPGFDHSSWPTGQAGFGYGDADDATELSGMWGNYLTVYLRHELQIPDASAANELLLHVSYDDGFVAYLNGVEVARRNVPLGQDQSTAAPSTHEAESFETIDLSGYLGLLVDGTNLIAVEGHNQSLSSNDFTLHPVLAIPGLAASGALSPVAVLLSDVSSANSPATVRFDATFSKDDDGSITSHLIDFGDGSGPVSAPQATHVYSSPGLYVATLIVTDDSGMQAIDEVPIHVHAHGKKPKIVLTVDDAFPASGATVSFDASASSDPDGGPLLHHWYFDDPASGSANQAVGPTASHVFATGGVHHVVLLVTDDEGSQVTQEIEVAVDGVPPPPGGGGGGGGCAAGPISARSGGARGDLSSAVVLAVLAGFLGWGARRARVRLLAGVGR